MKPPVALIGLLLAAAPLLHAQQQEEGMLQRIDANWRAAMKGMDVNSKDNPALKSNLASKSYEASSFTTKTFDTPSYLGVKDAQVKTFDTRSFLGIKNPWFGKKVYDTAASQYSKKEAREAEKQFESKAFEVSEYANSKKPDEADNSEILPNAAEPRPYLIPAKAQGAMDRFTENLHKDLSIDDVRTLLNKGNDR